MGVYSVLKSGVRWMICAGDNINIKNQPWLDAEDLYVSIESPSFELNKINSLMKVNSREWDMKIILDLFNERDQSCILNTNIIRRIT